MSSGLLSPALSWGGLTSVEENGSPSGALKILNGEMDISSSSASNASDVEDVFEAIAMPRKRSTLTREERIVKLKEDRQKRESTRDRIDANTHMLRELESVINLRPRGRTSLQQNSGGNENRLMAEAERIPIALDPSTWRIMWKEKAPNDCDKKWLAHCMIVVSLLRLVEAWGLRVIYSVWRYTLGGCGPGVLQGKGSWFVAHTSFEKSLRRKVLFFV